VTYSLSNLSESIGREHSHVKYKYACRPRDTPVDLIRSLGT
jgi:hypothetical protein